MTSVSSMASKFCLSGLIIFRAVAFVRLHSWFMAESDASFESVEKMWNKVPGFKDATGRKHWLGETRVVVFLNSLLKYSRSWASCLALSSTGFSNGIE